MHLTNLLASWIVLAVAFFATGKLLTGFQVKGFGGALVASAVFGVLNWLLGGLIYWLIGLLTLGLGFLLGFLTRWIVNALLLKLTDAVTDKLQVRSFGTAMVASLVMSVLTTLVDWVLR